MVVIGLEVNYLSNYYIKIVWMIFFSVFYKKKKNSMLAYREVYCLHQSANGKSAIEFASCEFLGLI